ncbi:hypothetical protein HELRODRAFT_167497 [Helobdella robusta]|uniref:G-protein coupled receptors family 1 profile domain-containing protein n=1 Tax=Helobdella robusta TaxID=6412 RepID=T1EZF6_HELRO|nr:hypothetical protein HELRODRAFT_167497 [Helobdella robusta]ESO10980.1 hypothetical protein HELRODRAFT_167497 [Helobdella robusta]
MKNCVVLNAQKDVYQNIASNITLKDYYFDSKFRYIAEVYISLPINIFGIIGNAMTFYILTFKIKKQKSQAIIFLLIALSFVDTLVLLFHLFLRTFRELFLEDVNKSFTEQ